MQVETNRKRIALAVGFMAIFSVFLYNNWNLFVIDQYFVSGYLYGAIALIILSGLMIGVKFKMPVQLEAAISVILFILSPFFSVYIVELLGFNDLFSISSAAVFLNLALCAGVYLLLYGLSNRFKWTIIGGQALFLIIGIANQVVLTFRGNPLFPWDIYGLRTAINVSSQYEFELNYQVIMAILIFICICAGSLQLNYKMSHKIGQITTRVTCAGVALLFMAVFYLTPLTTNWEIYPSLWNQPQGYKDNGAILSIADNAKYLAIPQPEGYSVAKVKELLGVNYEIEADLPELGIATMAIAGESADIPVEETTENPNVIAIMNEAWADLRVMGDFKTSQDEMPFIRSLEEDTIKGELLVSVYGGGTCNSEFEFLTGNTTAFLPAGSAAYQQYIQDEVPSLASTLNDQGYRSIAVHPYDKSGWNREKVYPLLGFEQFLSIDDFDLNQVNLAREVYIDDSSNYQKLIELYEAKEEEEKLFLFNVTIQNHGGYNLDDKDSLERVNVGSGEHPTVDQYLSLIKRTDQAFQELVTYFQKQQEPTIIVMFGDHQPNLPDEFVEELYGKKLSDLTLAETQKKFTVPYLIWANYDIEESTGNTISANYLSTLLLETAGLELSPFNRYLQNLSAQLPVINSAGYRDRFGHDWAFDQISPYNDLLNDYKIVQYNQLFDRKNRIRQFLPPIGNVET